MCCRHRADKGTVRDELEMSDIIKKVAFEGGSSMTGEPSGFSIISNSPQMVLRQVRTAGEVG